MQYAPKLIAECERFQAGCCHLGQHAVDSANEAGPLVCAKSASRFVSWVQDIYGLAAYRLLGRKLPGVGHAVGRYFLVLDKRSARRSDAIVVITRGLSPRS